MRQKITGLFTGLLLLALLRPASSQGEGYEIRFQLTPKSVGGVTVSLEGSAEAVRNPDSYLFQGDPDESGVVTVLLSEKQAKSQGPWIFQIKADGFQTKEVRINNLQRKFEVKMERNYLPWMLAGSLGTILLSVSAVLIILKKRPTVQSSEDPVAPASKEERVGKYVLKKKLGQGGMAEVHLAEADNQLYALKLVYPHIAAGKDFKSRFTREVSMGTKLIHPYIITVYEADEVDGKYFMALEYVEGSELRSLIPEGGFEFEQAREYLLPILQAVHFAHGKGVIHRDIKPDNILVKKDGTPKLSDFGLARSHDFSTVTATGTAMGTPAYMSPEQIQGQSVSEASDQYSLGVMAFELFTGELPFKEEEPLALIMKHLTQPPPLPSSLRPGLPEGVDPVVIRMMAKDPADRFPTVKEALEALKRITG